MDGFKRPVVSYDDITLPYDADNTRDSTFQTESSRPPPSKKRKWNKRRIDSSQQANEFAITQSEASYTQLDEKVELDEETRELTYEEVWDDSALIDAWNAATEEYEAFHGPDKGWKKEPIHKSPLWYNVPPATKYTATSAPKTTLASLAVAPTESEAEADSKPFDFDTFVPSHDPSLAAVSTTTQLPAVPFIKASSYQFSAAPETLVSQDEAFNRALNAMYWGGYWTAVYHCQRGMPSLGETSPQMADQGEEEEEEEEGEKEELEEDDDLEAQFIDTQR